MKLTVFNETELKLPVADLETLFEELVSGEKASDRTSEVNLIFIDDQRMRKLNRQYRGQDQTTDVLSFNIDEPDEPEGVLGEIYISMPVAVSQASEYGVTLALEVRRLFTHGLLHLLGYDHQEKQEAEKMFAVEEKYLGLAREND